MNKNAGFTLIEVLIAMLVLAFGLLGLAALQASSLGNNQNAYNRSQATQMAYDLADRMRANFTEANKLANSAYIKIDPTTAAEQVSCNSAPGCASEVMAENDLFQWNSVVNTLPKGIGLITVNSITRIFTINISWDDDHDEDDSNNINFATSFQL